MEDGMMGRQLWIGLEMKLCDVRDGERGAYVRMQVYSAVDTLVVL